MRKEEGDMEDIDSGRDRPPRSAMELLVHDARRSRRVLIAMQELRSCLAPAIRDLDEALASEQRDAQEMGAQLVRALVLHGTVDNLVQLAFRDNEEKETET